MKYFDIAIVGGGCVGYFAAQCLAHSSLNIALIASPTKPDNRTTALLASSVQGLKSLRIWEHVCEHAAPLQIMRLIDDTGALIRAPEITFKSDEVELEAFGYNIENELLLSELKKVKNITLFQEPVIDYESGKLTLENEIIQTHLTIAADGGRSFIREKANIETIKTDYPQWALTLNFSHSRPHGGASTEFHTKSGPFTLVPLLGNRSSLVWVQKEKPAENSNEILAEAIERQSQGILGKISNLSERGVFPLYYIQPRSLIAEKLALIGEAAHVMPPIGAQGMNLGFRDAGFITQLCIENFKDTSLLEKYAALRQRDILFRSAAIDTLNRSLLTSFLPVDSVRALGLHAINKINPLKQFIMKKGLAPDDLPKIMI